MKREASRRVVIVGVLVVLVSFGCADDDLPPATGPASEAVHAVALRVGRKGDLPSCNASRSGSVAYVSTPPGLWRCFGNQWHEIRCAPNESGAVAYESSTNTLWACVGEIWTEVALPDAGPGPQGPPGPGGDQGVAGAPALIVTQAEPPGANCPTGGNKVLAGTDVDRDGVLDSDEVSATTYVCNGATGAPGPAGDAGVMGVAGLQGPSGVSSLVALTPEPPGPNCAGGGTRIQFGLDGNGNGALDPGEVQQSAYVCNGTCSGGACADAAPDAGVETGSDLGEDVACAPTDDPDVPGDLNCDGLEGERDGAIFVSVSGSDAAAGSMASPKRTINAGIQAAMAAGRHHVYVAQGTYQERVSLTNGISLYGGYRHSQGGWWRPADSETVISSSLLSPAGTVEAVVGQQLSAPTVVSGFRILAGSGVFPGGSVYAVYCRDCGGLVLRNNEISAGNGAAGSSGSPGASGADGAPGGLGGGGSCDGNAQGAPGTAGTSPCGRTGGNGGTGAPEGGNGAPGGSGVGGTPGGIGGPAGMQGGPGMFGSDGAPGSHGIAGSGGGGGGVFAGLWVSGAGLTGSVGQPGNGGGGGGGGGGQMGVFVDDGSGNGGGGGGGGGCGAHGGTGGRGGGGSFGVFLLNSSGAILVDNRIAAGRGGTGGAGSPGGIRGFGGPGGIGGQACTDEVGRGGNGGRGGDGGNGGPGGGGAGGPSVAVYRQASAITLTDNLLTIEGGGLGGPGNGGLPGQPGVAHEQM